MTLKQQFIENFIPRVEIMLQKEIEHRDQMLAASNKTHHIYLGGLIKLPVQKRVNMIAFYYWRESEKMITHLTQRIQEYKEYATKL